MYGTAEAILSGDTAALILSTSEFSMYDWWKIVSVETRYCSDFQAPTEHLLLASNPKIIKQNALLKP